jgi:hypothetical protein
MPITNGNIDDTSNSSDSALTQPKQLLKTYEKSSMDYTDLEGKDQHMLDIVEQQREI